MCNIPIISNRYIHTHVHTCTHARKHTHIHTHTHTCTLEELISSEIAVKPTISDMHIVTSSFASGSTLRPCPYSYVCIAVCCSVLQCVAVCCSVLQCVAVCCSVLQYVALLHTYPVQYHIHMTEINTYVYIYQINMCTYISRFCCETGDLASRNRATQIWRATQACYVNELFVLSVKFSGILLHIRQTSAEKECD